jgi:hypothetical protein
MPFPDNAPTQWTSRGPKPIAPMLCWKCRQRKAGPFTMDPNGQPICPGCAGRVVDGVILDTPSLGPDAGSPLIVVDDVPVSVSGLIVDDGAVVGVREDVETAGELPEELLASS